MDKLENTYFVYPGIIKSFPYVPRYCPYCEWELKLVNAAHLKETPEHYKAIMICMNPHCVYYDTACREAYVKVYYSSQIAADTLWTFMLRFHRPKVAGIRYDEVTNEGEHLELFFEEVKDEYK